MTKEEPPKAVYGAKDLAKWDPVAELGEAGLVSVHQGPVCLDVHRASMDHSPVRRIR